MGTQDKSERYYHKGVKSRKFIPLATLVALVLVYTNAMAQDSEDEVGLADETEVVEEVMVIGSRIRGAEATSQTVEITSEEIEARGFNTVQDILDSLPQNFSGINTSTTSFGGSDVPGGEIANSNRFQGQSLADLRGLGTSNTLILVNGRRMATSSDAEVQSLGAVSGVNLSSIPFSAIESVEVILDGASAIYGADAIGGVINFILRKDYSGLEISARYEDGENGGDNQRYDAIFGRSWATGSVTINGSYSKSDPTSAAEAGFTTFNRVDMGGIDGRTDGSPALIYDSTGRRAGYMSPGDDGRTPLSADDLNGLTGRLSPVGERVVDNVPVYLDADNENVAFFVGFQQKLKGETLELYADIHYSKDESETVSNSMPIISQGFPFFGIPADVVVPTSNAFNDTGQDLTIRSFLYQEGLNGDIPQSIRRTSDERMGIVTGLIYRPNDNWTIDFSGGINEVESTYDNGVVSFDLDALQVLADSSDPNLAFNAFGDGTAQNDLSSALMFGLGQDSLATPSTMQTTEWLLTAEGAVFSLPGGDARIAVGAQYRDEEMNLDDDFLVGSGNISQALYATTNPSRSLLAGFVEAYIPLVGKDNRMPGIHALSMNIAARLDSYNASADTETTKIKNSYDHTSPKIGFAWSPIEALNVRANWNEAFRAPTMTQMFQADRFSTVFPAFYYNFFLVDPFAPEGADLPNDAPPVELRNGPNNDLEGETSESWSVGFDWTPSFLDSLYLSVNYNNTEITNQFDLSSAIYFDEEIWLASGYGPSGPANSVKRNEAGFITSLTAVPFNINGTKSESMDYRAQYILATDRAGQFDFTWSATQTLKHERDIVGVIDRLDNTDRGLPEWIHTGSVLWSRDNYSATFVINYTGSYNNYAGVAQILGRPTTPRDVEEMGLGEKVDSYTTYDLTGRYLFESIGLELSGGVINLTDEEFPYYNNRSFAPFDLRRVDPRGRRVFVRLKLMFDL